MALILLKQRKIKSDYLTYLNIFMKVPNFQNHILEQIVHTKVHYAF